MSENINWEKMDGLLPVIIQDATTLNVLMLGYMNKEAYDATLATKKVTFYSRSKKRLWVKGETSGNFLEFVDIKSDCDADALLVLANPIGLTCHLNQPSCFGAIAENRLTFLLKLEQIIKQKSQSNEENSYTKQLIDSGISRIAQKVGEEDVEVALAAVNEKDTNLCAEVADLVYHVLVLLRSRGLALENVVTVLEERHQKLTN